MDRYIIILIYVNLRTFETGKTFTIAFRNRSAKPSGGGGPGMTICPSGRHSNRRVLIARCAGELPRTEAWGLMTLLEASEEDISM